jgi:hypothetical protein
MNTIETSGDERGFSRFRLLLADCSCDIGCGLNRNSILFD